MQDCKKIEEKHLKPMIDKKEKRILLLRKIFRTANGFVHVLENNSMPNFYKIGWTERTPEERAKELSGTGLPMPYRVAYSKDAGSFYQKKLNFHYLEKKLRFFKNSYIFKKDL